MLYLEPYDSGLGLSHARAFDGKRAREQFGRAAVRGTTKSEGAAQIELVVGGWFGRPLGLKRLVRRWAGQEGR